MMEDMHINGNCGSDEVEEQGINGDCGETLASDVDHINLEEEDKEKRYVLCALLFMKGALNFLLVLWYCSIGYVGYL